MKYVCFSIFILAITYFILLFNGNNSLIVPFFMINFNFYFFVSIIIFSIVELALFFVYKKQCINTTLLFILIINYISFILFNFFFFYLENSFFALFFKLLQFYFSLLLNENLSQKNKISANFLALYIIWTFYLTLVSISIFFINNG